jgi:hypothetical protein
MERAGDYMDDSDSELDMARQHAGPARPAHYSDRRRVFPLQRAVVRSSLRRFDDRSIDFD